MTLDILAVDDSRTIRDLLESALKARGFRVRLAEDGEEGLKALESFDPDIIITDINMPRLDGFGFLSAVRSRPEMRGTPILVLTTESAHEMKARARDAGASGWIVKPFDPDSLVAAIRRVAG